MDVNNPDTGVLLPSAKLTWQVFRHSEFPQIEYQPFDRVLPSGVSGWYLRSAIPQNAESGVYDYYIFVTYKDRTDWRKKEFFASCP
jgi:hypothetical protein